MYNKMRRSSSNHEDRCWYFAMTQKYSGPGGGHHMHNYSAPTDQPAGYIAQSEKELSGAMETPAAAAGYAHLCSVTGGEPLSCNQDNTSSTVAGYREVSSGKLQRSRVAGESRLTPCESPTDHHNIAPTSSLEETEFLSAKDCYSDGSQSADDTEFNKVGGSKMKRMRETLSKFTKFVFNKRR